MNLRERFSEFTSRISDSLEKQVWYQQAKSKWEELPAQTRQRITLISLLSGFVMATSLSIAYWFHVKSIEHDLYQKLAIIELINNSADELRALRNSRPSGSQSGNWSDYFHDVAQNANIDSSIVQVSDEKPAAGNAKSLTKESYFTVTLAKSNVIQITQYAFELENGTRPVKIKQLDIDTHQDPEGYIDAKFVVSAFSFGDEQ